MNSTDKKLVERELVTAKADLVYLAKLIKRLRGKFINIADHVEDEGDRAYFGSTNHADEFKEGVQSLDDANWSLIAERAKGRDLYAEMRKLRAEAKALSTENAELREKLAERDAQFTDFSERMRAAAVSDAVQASIGEA